MTNPANQTQFINSTTIAAPTTVEPQEILNWIENEFQYNSLHSDGSPLTLQDIQSLSRGQMAVIWKYLLEHVKSDQTVKMIRGNLKLNSSLVNNKNQNKNSSSSSNTDSKGLASSISNNNSSNSSSSSSSSSSGWLEKEKHRNELIQRKQLLQQELEQLTQSVSAISAEQDKLLNDIDSHSKLLHQFQSTSKDLLKRFVLIKSYITKMNLELAERLKLASRIQRASQSSLTLSLNGSTARQVVESYVSMQEPNAHSINNLESTSMKATREACEHIENYLIARLNHTSLNNNTSTNSSSNSSNTNQSSFQDLKYYKSQAWKTVDEIMENYGPETIVSTLSNYSVLATAAVQSEINSMNFTSEAESYMSRFLTANEILHDDHGNYTGLKGVADFIEELQRFHISCCSESISLKNSISSIQEEIQKLKSNMLLQMETLFQKDPQMTSLLVTLQNLESQVVASEIKCQSLKKSLHKLREEKEYLEEIKSQLQQAKQRLSLAQKQTKISESLVRDLLSKNKESAHSVKEKQLQLISLVKNELLPYKTAINTSSNQLVNVIDNELKSFRTLQLSKTLLSFLISSKIPVCELSINRLNPKIASEPISQLLANLQFPKFKSPEKFFEHVLGFISNYSTLYSRVNQLEYILKKNTQAMTNERVEENIGKILDWRKACSNDIIPQINNAISHSEAQLEKCKETQIILSEWWNQPAQYLTPWVTIDGKNLQEWIELYTSLANRLKQLSGGRSK